MNEVESVVFSSGDIERKVQETNTKTAKHAAKELLKNGILVETKKGVHLAWNSLPGVGARVAGINRETSVSRNYGNVFAVVETKTVFLYFPCKGVDLLFKKVKVFGHGLVLPTFNEFWLVCMSLKDALNEGVGGHNLSAEDFQTVATKLLFQDQPNQMVVENTTGRANNSLNLRKGHKPMRKIKMNSSKFPIVSLMQVPDTFNSSQVDLEEFKDIQDSLLDFSPLEYSLVDKADTEKRISKNVSVPVGNSLKIGAIVNKHPLGNRRSLIIKNNVKPVISVQRIVRNKSESKTDCNGVESILLDSGPMAVECGPVDISCEETSDNSEVTSFVTNKAENKPVKKRGGWPKGRKRKPEIKQEIRPPKAPATGYVIFLNEKRKDYRDMPFTEVTKLLGNEWSKLSLQEKKVYLDQAEVEKKRYREELKAYRQSDAYQSYLHKKRLKKLQGHGTEESDMDATDEIDEEDNEELYCRSCDQWFHSLHNKKEHLYGRQHLQSIAGRYSSKLSDLDWCNANMSSTSLDESSLDGSSYLKGSKEHCCNKNQDSLNMDDAIVNFMVVNKEREEERCLLRKKLEESKGRNQVLSQDLLKLNETLEGLTCMLESERTAQILLEQRLFNLLNVPTLFYLPEPLSEDNN